MKSSLKISKFSGGESGRSVHLPLGVAAGDSRDKGRGVRISGRGAWYNGLLTDEEGVMKTED